jgi:hypothetical protein
LKEELNMAAEQSVCNSTLEELEKLLNDEEQF